MSNVLLTRIFFVALGLIILAKSVYQWAAGQVLYKGGDNRRIRYSESPKTFIAFAVFDTAVALGVLAAAILLG